MYARKVGKHTLDFQVSGKLWAGSLIMLDIQTESEWSHLYGQAMAGTLKDTMLEQIPSTMTTWGAWQKLHPKSTVAFLERSAKEYELAFLRKIGLQRFALGVVWQKKAYAWSLHFLNNNAVHNQTLSGTAVVAMFDRQSTTARLFLRNVDGKTHSFTANDDQIVDDQTGSKWHPITGKAIEGSLKGKMLQALPAFMTFIDAWARFHPECKWTGIVKK